jgi:Zn-dependent protease with chaperone function
MSNAGKFIHPADRAALENLKIIPLLPALTKAYIKMFSEQYFHGLNMAQKIRLGPDQFPKIYRHLPPICEKLGIAEPELYLEMNPQPNAYTMGDSRIFITVTSSLLEYMDEGELQAVLAHECGHIACRHMLYHSMAQMIAQYGMDILGPLELPAKPVIWALFYWFRRSEFSADRAAAFALGSEKEMTEALIRLAGGPKQITEKINLEAYMAQADAYDRLCDSAWDKILQTVAVAEMSHPLNSVRVRELNRWCKGPDFRKMLQDGLKTEQAVCPVCGTAVQTGWKFCQTCGQKLDG